MLQLFKLNEKDYYKIENFVLKTNYDIIWINSILNQRQKVFVFTLTKIMYLLHLVVF